MDEKQNGLMSDDPQGFANFYRLIFEREPPEHAMRDWIVPLYRAKTAGKGLVVAAFRGSTKTTTLSIAFAAFRIGLHPQKSHLIVQASDQAAKDTAAQIADLIGRSAGWQTAFGHVQPDRKAGWGADGYEVNNTRADYGEWRKRCAADKGKDPTFVGLGYQSRTIIGKHPTGLLLIDDIHDESNTRSARELQTVIATLTGTILPTALPDTWQLAVGTPWRENDALAHLAATRRFVSVSTPVLRGSKPAWPARFPKREIRKIRDLVGEGEFARMFMLDPKAAQGLHLKAEWLHAYPHEKLRPDWPVVMGVDYASAADKLKGDRRDYFAVAIGRALPGGGVVLVDGFRDKLSQGEAEDKLKELAALYPRVTMIGVESVGKGEEFFHLMLRSTYLPLHAMHPGSASKGERFERGMAPLFESSRVWVADVETPFLRAFRDEWLQWPGGDHDDTLDAVFWMLRVAVDYVTVQPTRRERGTNPMLSFARR
jgi:phage terminase large subunit-like protein